MIERIDRVGDQVIFYWIRLIKTHMRTVFQVFNLFRQGFGQKTIRL
jgi:hypothetical protein